MFDVVFLKAGRATKVGYVKKKLEVFRATIHSKANNISNKLPLSAPQYRLHFVIKISVCCQNQPERPSITESLVSSA